MTMSTASPAILPKLRLLEALQTKILVAQGKLFKLVEKRDRLLHGLTRAEKLAMEHDDGTLYPGLSPS